MKINNSLFFKKLIQVIKCIVWKIMHVEIFTQHRVDLEMKCA